jgi:hypothetical protein
MAVLLLSDIAVFLQAVDFRAASLAAKLVSCAILLMRKGVLSDGSRRPDRVRE